MDKEIQEITSAESFKENCKKVKRKIGKEPLTDDDLFILLCKKIMRTYTFEEKGYQ